MKYKLTALIFFFVLFAAFFLQFVRPYRLAYTGELGNSYFIIPLLVLALVLLVYLFTLHFKEQTKPKILPLIGAGLVLGLLFYAHAVNRVENLDPATKSQIIKHFHRP